MFRAADPVHWCMAGTPLSEHHIRDAAAARALFAPLARMPREVTAFAYLGPEWRLLGMRHCGAGGIDSAEVPLRRVACDALAFDAVAVIMAHNHPSGDPTPSESDYAVTRRLARALDALGVRLTDHLVLAGDAVTSLYDTGYL